MEALFLGTSAGWPLPRLGCHCPLCASSDKRDQRLRPSLLVEKKILLDAPPDVYHQLRRYSGKLEQIEYVFLTHAHLDHVLGLYDLTHTYLKRGGNFGKKRFSLFLNRETLKSIRKIFNFPLSSSFDIHLVQSNEVFSVAGMEAVFFPVRHSRISTWGIKIKKEKTISYLPDFCEVPSVSRDIIKRNDILVLDGTNLLMKKRKGSHWGHADGETIISLVKDVRPKHVFFTHIGHGHYSAPHIKLEKWVQEKGGKNWHVAYDGMEIIV